jgi:hypothetical protein
VARKNVWDRAIPSWLPLPSSGLPTVSSELRQVPRKQTGALLIAACIVAVIRLWGEPIVRSPKLSATVADSVQLAKMVEGFSVDSPYFVAGTHIRVAEFQYLLNRKVSHWTRNSVRVLGSLSLFVGSFSTA